MCSYPYVLRAPASPFSPNFTASTCSFLGLGLATHLQFPALVVELLQTPMRHLGVSVGVRGRVSGCSRGGRRVVSG